jgi:hypothetical protein
MAEKAEIRRQKIRPPGFVNDFNCLRRPGWRRIVESEIRRKSAEIGRKPLKRRLPHPFGAGGMGVAAMQ